MVVFMDLYQYERELYKNGIKYIAGVDEVGRGPLIGPVVSACVVLRENFIPEGLTDSKKLSEKKRDMFYDIIMENALGVGIGIVDACEIDKINIYEASKKSMILAIENCNCKIDHVLIDAMKLDINIPSTSIIKGDAKSISIAAASVIAKVTRDRMMYELDKKYPMYGFKDHKGYPTKKHVDALNKYGLIEGYRKTYGPVKDYINSI
jgi:ribonuclease HII